MPLGISGTCCCVVEPVFEYCCGCIEDPSNSLTVDIGVGGWTGNICCGGAVGEWEVGQKDTQCYWYTPQYSSAHLICQVGSVKLFFEADIQLVNDGGGFYHWEATIAVRQLGGFGTGQASEANYSTSSEDCSGDECSWMDGDGKIWLDKDSEVQRVCTGGAMPNQISFWENR